MSEKNIKRIILGVLCISLTGFCFYYDSGWAGIGATIALFSAIDG